MRETVIYGIYRGDKKPTEINKYFRLHQKHTTFLIRCIFSKYYHVSDMKFHFIFVTNSLPRMLCTKLIISIIVIVCNIVYVLSVIGVHLV